MIKIGIIGTGYWGKHHLRNFSKLPCEVVGIADIDASKSILANQYGVKFYTDYHKLLKKVDAVSVVTPPSTHFKIARKVLKSGRHVLLEKPFVFKSKEALELERIAAEKKLTVMPGHTYLYNPAIQKIKEMIDNGETGKVYYLFMDWLNLGIIRRDVNSLWNFGPHPFSILSYIFGKLPVSLSCMGTDFIQEGIEDYSVVSLNYTENISVKVSMSWLHPLKVRNLTVVGSKKMLYFDDVSSSPLKVFDKGITPEEFANFSGWDSYAEFRNKSKYGDIEIPNTGNTEPLYTELADFIESCRTGRPPRSDIKSAIYTVKMLESAQKSLKKEGRKIAF